MNPRIRNFLLSCALVSLPLAAASAGGYQGTFTTLYAFTGGADGAQPNAPLAVDSFHDLYGVAELGGVPCDNNDGCGTIFKLTAQGQLTVLHQFSGAQNGELPLTGISLNHEVLYGSAQTGGPGYGMLYSINKDGTNFTVIHHFTGTDGAYPDGTLLPAAGGGLYGITRGGGLEFNPDHRSNADGVVFWLQPDGKMVLLHNFTGADGVIPLSLLQDAQGNLFGTTQQGGPGCSAYHYGCGVVFEITSQKPRSFKILYAFNGTTDGSAPFLGSIGSDGTLYGVASPTTATPHGVIFSLAPTGADYQFAIVSNLNTGMSFDRALPGPVAGPAGSLVSTTTFTIDAVINQQFLHYNLGGVPNGVTLTGPVTVAADGTVYGACAGSYDTECGSTRAGSIYSFTLTKATP